MNALGFNPMRWDCKQQGCFNVKKRPKIEVFADCFPGRINFSDVDGIVEIKARGLLLEWKPNAQIRGGQQIMYQQLTPGGWLTVLAIAGNAESMEVQSRCVFFEGKQHPWHQSSLVECKSLIRRWVAWAQHQPLPLRAVA